MLGAFGLAANHMMEEKIKRVDVKIDGVEKTINMRMDGFEKRMDELKWLIQMLKSGTFHSCTFIGSI